MTQIFIATLIFLEVILYFHFIKKELICVLIGCLKNLYLLLSLKFNVHFLIIDSMSMEYKAELRCFSTM